MEPFWDPSLGVHWVTNWPRKGLQAILLIMNQFHNFGEFGFIFVSSDIKIQNPSKTKTILGGQTKDLMQIIPLTLELSP